MEGLHARCKGVQGRGTRTGQSKQAAAIQTIVRRLEELERTGKSAGGGLSPVQGRGRKGASGLWAHRHLKPSHQKSVSWTHISYVPTEERKENKENTINGNRNKETQERAWKLVDTGKMVGGDPATSLIIIHQLSEIMSSQLCFKRPGNIVLKGTYMKQK